MRRILNMTRIAFVFCLLAPVMIFAQGSLRLPSVLSDHMILQQDTEVNFWGWANPQTTIYITTGWSKDTITVKASEKAKWETIINTPSSGGPFEIRVTSKDETIIIKDVMIGELWICSGQSNMEYSANHGVLDAKEALASCENNEIRLFYVEKATADFPQDNLSGSWKVCNAESISRFSAVGYFFGQKLNEQLGIPVGLINSNWGGTPIETWTPENGINDLNKVREESQYLKKSTGWDNTISSTFNAMIHPLLKMKMAGVIWYQGESNCPNAYSYAGYLTTMIRSWRSGFKTNLPFYYVQIAPFLKYPIPYSAAILREQQAEVQEFPNTGMVVITDLVDNLNNIHPKYKKEVGYRLANCALAETYGRETSKYKFASLKNYKIEKRKIRIYFDNAEGGITIKGDKIEGLEIAGENNIFYTATGKVDPKSSTLLVGSKEVKNPVNVRYAFGNGIIGNLFDNTDLPIAPFRTDTIKYDLAPKN